MKKDENKLYKYLKDYFTIYLLRQRNCSSHTIIACRQTWNIFLKYLNKSLNIKLETINFNNINSETVTSFLDEMEQESGMLQQEIID